LKSDLQKLIQKEEEEEEREAANEAPVEFFIKESEA